MMAHYKCIFLNVMSPCYKYFCSYASCTVNVYHESENLSVEASGDTSHLNQTFNQM